MVVCFQCGKKWMSGLDGLGCIDSEDAVLGGLAKIEPPDSAWVPYGRSWATCMAEANFGSVMNY